MGSKGDKLYTGGATAPRGYIEKHPMDDRVLLVMGLTIVLAMLCLPCCTFKFCPITSDVSEQDDPDLEWESRAQSTVQSPQKSRIQSPR